MAKRWSGYLILGMWLLNLLHLYLGFSPWPAAIAAWGASLLTWPWLVGAARRQALALYGAALLLLIFSWWRGASLNPGDWLLPNINMLTMFAAVSTLNLATSGLLTGTASWSGRKGLWSTMASLNLLGSVINLSVLFIIGDRLERNGTLERRQVMVLSRIFCAAAFWSPFFVAMAVALTYAPGLQLSSILPFGVVAALLAMGLTAWQVERLGVQDFAGYPLRLQTLGLLVLLIKQIWPALGILAVIALVAPLLALLFMPRAGRGAALKRQVVERFPAIGGQLVLFLGAGLLAAGINSALSVLELGGEHGLPLFNHFGWLESSLTLLLILLVAIVGVHPLISISGLAPLLWPLSPDPSLLGMCFLLGWGLATGTSPLSGSNLALASRYNLSAGMILRWNLLYGLLMYGVACLLLGAYVARHG
ncbi:hypothetical protein WH06_23600 [Aeromonas salmonicida subsp. salmonicida]|uniref:Uncharacterized protein n=2 Tax=Aeromonas salmonicida subsp. salmonicida TaxID=29491 RepID=A4STA5_AERS4|nr:hypothetical protein [Aeromonas salmonicida]ABO92127.1 conserved hypothetical protein [Aeromonas salmonicida subsp. salmonicida A449]AYO65084.1 hypothetical protein C5P03_21425 [Aeromonas salmonicida subsp. salmonicida 01-B526]EHI50233.1 hypothetical protein IYQ_22585 [Aeromonas salmonicida subsp. salmonicida 01-B526]EKP0240917.1 hypothetical protein [Aeromonas salmonicida]EKP0245162.1 hypothetical protein [Aeromonas salmonicida]